MSYRRPYLQSRVAPSLDRFLERRERHTMDAKNGLLLNFATENAFDAGRIVVYEDAGTLKFHVLDPGLKKFKIVEYMGQRKAESHTGLGDIRFGDLEGAAVHFKNDNRPFRRCLCFHAQVSRRVAIESGWEGAEAWDLTSYYSLDDTHLAVAQFLSQMTSTSMNTRISIGPLPDRASNDQVFERARKLVRRRVFS